MRITISFITISLFIILNATAQSTGKLLLNQGQKITSVSTMKMNNKQNFNGTDMELKVDNIATAEIVVKEATKGEYKLECVFTKMKMDFDGFGQKQTYDSEKKSDEKSEIGTSLKGFLNTPQTFQVDTNAQIKTTKDKAQNSNTLLSNDEKYKETLQNMLFVLPVDKKVGDVWRTEKMEEGIKTITENTLVSLIGNDATITQKQQTKGTKAENVQGNSVITKMNVLTEATLVVDVSVGLVKSKVSIIRTTTTATMMGQESPSSGTVNYTVNYTW